MPGLAAAMVCAGLVWAACGPQSESPAAAPEAEEALPPPAAPAAEAGPDLAALRQRAAAALGALPAEVPNPENPLSEAKIDLGRTLYYETRLSKSQQISCNSCHPLAEYGADGEPTSPGHEGQRGERNSPSVYNAALHIAQFWDGRAADVEEQAIGPILNPVEMAMGSDVEALEVLDSIPDYRPMFEEAFPGEEPALSYANVGKAIGAFERRLLTPGPLDAFLAGDDEALSEDQLRGLETFLDVGCTTCHQGAAVGGGMFQKLGLVRPYPTEDRGRAAVTGKEADAGFFKVPSLRNVEKTGPWFHDGSIASLDEAIRIMAAVQLGRDLSDDEVASIRSFLGALTGELPSDYIAPPELPPAGPDTPGPPDAA